MQVRETFSHRLQSMLIALGLAVLVWFLVLMERPAQLELLVPVRVAVPDGMVCTTPVPKELRVLAWGARGSLFALSRSLPDAVVPPPADGEATVVIADTSKLVLLPETIRLMHVEPAQLRVSFQPRR